ncbi:protein disulfide isomerase [Histomonas meleagridis]|uniref:protein disulfide isomerase n=1 Tax=Histomonas meleagridis TaxID=135588 RepID=UPI0035599285|nr:protein disulfide isomerase [Histomonas meleagridis]KAH0807155.1 protein disulfide isomerase [Histomonas meleagridis]
MSDIPVAFVMTYQENVSFCIDLLPKFRAVAEMMKEKCKFVVIEKESTPQIRKKYHIFAYPSLFIFRYGNATAEYKGKRDSSSMYKYLKRILGDSVITLESARDVHDFLDENKISVILAGEELDEIMPSYKSVASALTDIVPFAVATTEDAIQQLGVDEVPSLKVYRQVDRQTIDYSLVFKVTAGQLFKWFVKSIVPRYKELDSVVFRDLAFDSRYTLLAFVDTNRKPSFDLMHNTLDKIVSTYDQNLTYVYCDIYDMGNTVINLGFSGYREPIYCIVKITGGEITEKYLYPENKKATPNNIARWVGSFLNKTSHIIKSEEPPESQKGPLFKIVGRTFQDSILDSDHDILTLILVGDSTERELSYNNILETANEFYKQKIDTVKFCYIDYELNDLPGLQKQNWTSPVYLFWPYGQKKNAMLMNGSISAEQLMKELKKYAKIKNNFKIPPKYDIGDIEL